MSFRGVPERMFIDLTLDDDLISTSASPPQQYDNPSTGESADSPPSTAATTPIDGSQKRPFSPVDDAAAKSSKPAKRQRRDCQKTKKAAKPPKPQKNSKKSTTYQPSFYDKEAKKATDACCKMQLWGNKEAPWEKWQTKKEAEIQVTLSVPRKRGRPKGTTKTKAAVVEDNTAEQSRSMVTARKAQKAKKARDKSAKSMSVLFLEDEQQQQGVGLAVLSEPAIATWYLEEVGDIGSKGDADSLFGDEDTTGEEAAQAQLEADAGDLEDFMATEDDEEAEEDVAALEDFLIEESGDEEDREQAQIEEDTAALEALLAEDYESEVSEEE